MSSFNPSQPPPPNYHRHQCAFCNYVWEHHDENDVKHGRDGAHECPGCHRCNWSLGIYTGTREPQVRNGVEPTWHRAPVENIHPDQDPRAGGT